MKQLADGVWQLGGFPPNVINVYVIEDVLIDAASRHAARRILRQIDGRPITAHALTHAHPDHQGASHAVCARLGVPYWVGGRDVDAAEDPNLIGALQPATRSPPLLPHVHRPGPSHRPPPHRGRRRRRLPGARRARALGRPRRLLARVRPRPHPR